MKPSKPNNLQSKPDNCPVLLPGVCLLAVFDSSHPGLINRTNLWCRSLLAPTGSSRTGDSKQPFRGG